MMMMMMKDIGIRNLYKLHSIIVIFEAGVDHN